ncbi:MAG TPA: hypothetical protein VIK35_09765 [Verrucomicrobiae bacterium]
MKIETTNNDGQGGLVDAPRLLEQIFPDPACRPSLRWLRANQRQFPHVRLGRLIFFSVPMVKSHLATKAMKGKATP